MNPRWLRAMIDAVVRADAALGEGVRQRVGALVQLLVGELPALVDDGDVVRLVIAIPPPRWRARCPSARTWRLSARACQA